MHPVRRIPREVPVSVTSITVLILSWFPLISHACAEQVGVIELLSSVPILAMPMLYFHPAPFRANSRKTIAAKPSLFLHKIGPQSIFVAVAVVVGARGCPMLGQTGWLPAFRNPPHTLDSRKVINARARVTSGSSDPSFDSTSASTPLALSKSSLSIAWKSRFNRLRRNGLGIQRPSLLQERGWNRCRTNVEVWLSHRRRVA